MSKKVLIISSSLRGGSNSECLARECERGAKDAGHDVQFISLKGKELKFCIGCLSCQETGKCVLKDDAADIMAAVYNAEVIVFATPIYYYEMCGQLKTLLDRMSPLFPSDYKFRDIYMIATAEEDEPTTFDKAYNGLLGWVDCFEKASLKGIVTGAVVDILWLAFLGSLGIYEILPGCILGLIVGVVVTLATPAPHEDVTALFDKVAAGRE